MELSDQAIEEIRGRRLKTLVGVWEAIKTRANFENKLELSTPLVHEVVEHYLMDLRILRKRYQIVDRIQLHKVAGLMTCAIMRFRPVIPLVEDYESPEQMYANEMLGIIQGVAICGEYTATDGKLEILEEPWFSQWYMSFRYLLHHRNFTSESIIFAYETLACLKFPNNFTKLD